MTIAVTYVVQAFCQTDNLELGQVVGQRCLTQPNGLVLFHEPDNGAASIFAAVDLGGLSESKLSTPSRTATTHFGFVMPTEQEVSSLRQSPEVAKNWMWTATNLADMADYVKQALTLVGAHFRSSRIQVEAGQCGEPPVDATAADVFLDVVRHWMVSDEERANKFDAQVAALFDQS